jgi:hypothetical protein
MKARSLRGAENLVAPIVLFGMDQHGKTKAALFAAEQGHLASKAAEQLKLRVLKVIDPVVAEIAAQLPAGRIHASGRNAVPYVSSNLYVKLVAVAEPSQAANNAAESEAADAGSKSMPPSGNSGSADQHQTYWDTIKAGQLVLTHEEGDDDWYYALVVERTADMCTLRWRDYSRTRKIVRHCKALALLHPGDSTAATRTKPRMKTGSAEVRHPGQQAAEGLPLTWEDIDVGHLVLAKSDAPSWVGNSCNRRNAVGYSARCGIGDYRRLRLGLMLEFPQLRSDLFKSNKIKQLVAFQATRPVLSQPFARRASHRPLPPITVGLRSMPPEMYQSPPSLLQTAHWGRQVDQIRGGPHATK